LSVENKIPNILANKSRVIVRHSTFSAFALLSSFVGADGNGNHERQNKKLAKNCTNALKKYSANTRVEGAPWCALNICTTLVQVSNCFKIFSVYHKINV
jgi:hypothetical protein